MSLGSVLRNDRAVEVIVQAGAEDVLGDLALVGHAGSNQIGGFAEIDIEIFGLAGPLRPEQAEQLERGFEASAGGPAGLGAGQVSNLNAVVVDLVLHAAISE